MSRTHDAIVIGSGITGGWAAKELTENGLKVLLLDRGRNIEHIKDYVNAMRAPWDVPHRGADPTAIRDSHPVLTRGNSLDELNIDWWADEEKNPYSEAKPFNWNRAYVVGGRSLLWGRQSYRWSDLDFEANARDGVAIDWPIRYADLAPWYDRVEQFIGIAGSIEGLPHLPDGQFQPPMELNCVEKHIAERWRHIYPSRRLISSRTANLTQPLNNRGKCQYRARCHLGCPFGGYFSSQSSTLPAAMKTGNLTLRTDSIVSRIIFDKDRRRATGVEIFDSNTRDVHVFRSRLIFVCASTLNSAWLLMNSATDVWPGGLGSSSGELGHNIMDHHFNCGASGRLDGFADHVVFGRRPTAAYVPRFRNLGENEGRGYIRGFGYQGRASRLDWRRNTTALGIGAGLKATLLEPGEWVASFNSFGETLPYHDNQITLDYSKHDAWGLPVLSMNCTIRDNEVRMRKDMVEDIAEMLDAAGLKDVRKRDSGYTFGACIHEMGAARMGRDPRTSVLNSHNQVWDAVNVFVTDGACMASSSCVNPSLTYMAITARAAHFAVEELKRGNL